jgi:Tfp pilus assembly protein PilO
MLFRERQQILICIVAAIMVIGFVLFRYLPLQKKRKALEQAKTAQTLAIAGASAQQQQLPILKEQLLKLQMAAGNYQASIPSQRDLGAFLHKIADLMNKQNLTDQVVQPGEEIKAGELNCIPVNMQCKGELTQIFEFYKQLQGLDRLVRIEQVNLTNEKDFSGTVTMQTKAAIYCRPEAGQG